VTATATPTAAAGASPAATATAAATLAPGASPSPSPNPNPTTQAQIYWAFNYFTIQNNTVLDSLGLGGPTDTTFSTATIDTQITQDTPFFKATGGTIPSNPAAQLSGGDIQNYQ
jgi:hypothetical protein